MGVGQLIRNVGEALKLTNARTIATTGDATYSVSFDGSANVSSAITLANTGVAAGTYNALATQVRPFTVNAKGLITGTGAAVDITPAWSAITGTPTTLAGYGITNALPLSGGTVSGVTNFSNTTPSTSTTTGASVVAGGQGIGGNQHIGGFTSLGGVPGGHPAIKMKVLEGTMAATQGGEVNVAHGLTISKIVSITVLVSVHGLWICHSYQRDATYEFNFIADNTNLTMLNLATNSSGILSRPFVATIFYKE